MSIAVFFYSSKMAVLSLYVSTAFFSRRVQIADRISDINFSQGILAGFDQKSNIVLSDCKERVFSMDDGVEEIPLGLYLVKGDMMYVIFFFPSSLENFENPFLICLFDDRILIGELDEAIDSSTDLPSIRADPILPIRY